jgi:hypothetical protein
MLMNGEQETIGVKATIAYIKILSLFSARERENCEALVSEGSVPWP